MPGNFKLCEIIPVKENEFYKNQVGGRNKIYVYAILQFTKSLNFLQMIDYLCHD